jgi:hypothetical protein
VIVTFVWALFASPLFASVRIAPKAVSVPPVLAPSVLPALTPGLTRLPGFDAAAPVLFALEGALPVVGPSAIPALAPRRTRPRALAAGPLSPAAAVPAAAASEGFENPADSPLERLTALEGGRVAPSAAFDGGPSSAYAGRDLFLELPKTEYTRLARSLPGLDTAAKRESAARPPAGFGHSRREIASILQPVLGVLRTPPAIRRLAREAPEILSVADEINFQGYENRGVFAVETPLGRKALKIASGRSIRQLRIPLAIQMVLSRLGWAPKVRGLYEGKALRKLSERFGFEARIAPEQRETKGPFVGILMDEIEGGWNHMKRQAPPAWIAGLDAFRVAAQYRAAEAVFNALKLKVGDRQALIAPDSRLWFIDFDKYTFEHEGVAYSAQNVRRGSVTRNNFDFDIGFLLAQPFVPEVAPPAAAPSGSVSRTRP